MPADIQFLNDLYAIIDDKRKNASPDDSYVANLSKKGIAKIAQKVGEEATETVIEAVAGRRKELIYESSDLLFHLMVLWANSGIKLDDIIQELYGRQCKVKPKKS